MFFPPGTFLLFAALFTVWAALCGFSFWSFPLTGLPLAFLIARITWKPFFGRRVSFSPDNFLHRGYALLAFVPYFLFAMVKASWDVALQAFRPELSITPGTFTYTPSLASKGSIVALANAITLTPGTLTIDISRNRRELLVHALSTESGKDALCEDIRKLEEGIGRFTE